MAGCSGSGDRVRGHAQRGPGGVCAHVTEKAGKKSRHSDHARPGSLSITFHPLPPLPKTLLSTRWSI